MTSDTVTLFTDRPGFTPLWRDALERHGFSVKVHSSDEVGTFALRNHAVVFDAATPAFDDDELLTVVGFARAAGGFPIVHAERAVEDVVEEICLGQVCRSSEDVERVAGAIARRLDPDRSRRFEFVTVSPSGDVLAILGDGHATLLKRPVTELDDKSDVLTIELSDDASSVTLELDSKVRFELHAAAFSVGERTTTVDIPIDGTRLGARLRQLRLEAGLTQAELAKRTGIHRPNIARVEAGRHTPSLETLARLASAIGVPTTRVLSED